MNLIPSAIRFAEFNHRGQVREVTGDPYIAHPIRVADMVSRHKLASEQLIAAAYLHDVVEDCGVSDVELMIRFGVAVSRYVQWMTNTSKLTHPQANRAERKRLDRERIAGAPCEVKVLKMCDRIDNLREIGCGDFASLYAAESRALCEVLASADVALAVLLRAECEAVERRCEEYIQSRL